MVLSLSPKPYRLSSGGTGSLPLTTQQFSDIFDGIKAINHQGTRKSFEMNVAGMARIAIHLNHAIVETQVNTNPGSFFVQGSPHEASGISNDWTDIAQFTVSNGTALSEPVNATEDAGETAIAMAADPGYAVEELVYIQNTSAIDTSEWHLVQQTAANVLTLVDGLRFQQTNADSVIFNLAEKFVAEFSVSAYRRVRVVYNHQGAVGANVHIAGYAILVDGVVG